MQIKYYIYLFIFLFLLYHKNKLCNVFYFVMCNVLISKNNDITDDGKKWLMNYININKYKMPVKDLVKNGMACMPKQYFYQPQFK